MTQGDKYLITTDAWFYAPDGQQYRAVWGKVTIVDDAVLGLKTNRNSTNWYAKIGGNDNHVIVAGCQIHYAVKCVKHPNVDDIEQHEYSPTDEKKVNTRTRIYIAK